MKATFWPTIPTPDWQYSSLPDRTKVIVGAWDHHAESHLVEQSLNCLFLAYCCNESVSVRNSSVPTWYESRLTSLQFPLPVAVLCIVRRLEEYDVNSHILRASRSRILSGMLRLDAFICCGGALLNFGESVLRFRFRLPDLPFSTIICTLLVLCEKIFGVPQEDFINHISFHTVPVFRGILLPSSNFLCFVEQNRPKKKKNAHTPNKQSYQDAFNRNGNISLFHPFANYIQTSRSRD